MSRPIERWSVGVVDGETYADGTVNLNLLGQRVELTRDDVHDLMFRLFDADPRTREAYDWADSLDLANTPGRPLAEVLEELGLPQPRIGESGEVSS